MLIWKWKNKNQFNFCQNLKYEDLNEKFIIHYISQKYRDTSMKFTRSLIYSIYFEDSLGHAENIFKVDGYVEISKFSNMKVLMKIMICASLGFRSNWDFVTSSHERYCSEILAFGLIKYRTVWQPTNATNFC